MSATNYTTNLSLSQFGNTDMPAWRQDYNGDMLKIDNAYTADISSATAETSADPSDYMKFYDVSATTNKKILISDLLKGAKVEDLTDTDITTPVDNDGLVYDSTSQKWENKPVVTGDLWVKNGAHNLCPTDNITQVDKGITFTFNAKKTVTLSGSNTTGSTAVCQLFADTYAAIGIGIEEGEQYIISGLTGGSLSTYCLELSFFNSSKTNLGNAVVVTDSEKTFTVPSTTAYIRATLYVYTGVTGLNVMAYPMIRLASDTDTTYAPYAMTNRELTEVKNYRYQTSSADTNVTYLECNVLRSGRVVYITGSWQGNNTNAESILTLPSELRPSYTVIGTGGLYVPSHPTITSQFGVYNLATNGKITQAMDTRKGTMGNFVFIYNL